MRKVHVQFLCASWLLVCLLGGCSTIGDMIRDMKDGDKIVLPEIVPGKDEDDILCDDMVPAGDLHWRYGGVDGSRAVLADGCRIADLRVSCDRMSYRWTSGGCEELGGASGPHDANCICALFVLRDGVWAGGKFDWISTDRTIRFFDNITGRYNGWPSDSIGGAESFAFCIISRDGLRRTNIIRLDGGAR